MANKFLKPAYHALIRFWVFRIRFPWVVIGRNVICQPSCWFWSPRRSIKIGNNVGIGFNCFFQSDIVIGDDVMIASQVGFISSDDHNYDVLGKSMRDSGRGDKHSIVVEEDVWIGFGAIIMSPAHLGRGSIIAAGSVVKGDVEPYSIVGGIPAKRIKFRFTPEQIVLHEEMKRNGVAVRENS